MRKVRILITAGSTQEKMDPVRFISNVATGVLGYELTRAAQKLKHPTVLISGPTELRPPKGARLIRVTSSLEMKKAVEKEFPRCDILLMTAAVCDFMPVSYSSRKIKRKPSLLLKVRETPDILASVARRRLHQKVIGFCLETENLLKNAAQKLRRKELDFIVATFLGHTSYPFGRNKMGVTVLGRDGSHIRFPSMSKPALARKLLSYFL